MRRAALFVAALVVSGCPQPPTHSMQICDDYEDPCGDGFECLGFHCIAACKYEGDCDPGFRCVDEQCIESCEAQPDCTIGRCGPIDDGRPGSACALVDLPLCGRDVDCGWDGVCVDGGCFTRCGDWPGQCGGAGLRCNLVRDGYGACQVDPDYTPPAPPANCYEAPSPDSWCVDQTGRANTFCDGSGCARNYQAILIVEESDPASCDDTDPSPGADLLGLRIVDPTGAGETYFSTFSFGTGAGNLHREWTAIEAATEPICDDEAEHWMNLGCGGGAVALPGAGPIRPGWNIAVYTATNWCSGPEDGAFSVYLCPQFPSDVESARQSCDDLLGSSSSGTVLTVPTLR